MDAANGMDARDLMEVVARTAARKPIPHVLGARVTVVTLTPSNYYDGCQKRSYRCK